MGMAMDPGPSFKLSLGPNHSANPKFNPSINPSINPRPKRLPHPKPNPNPSSMTSSTLHPKPCSLRDDAAWRDVESLLKQFGSDESRRTHTFYAFDLIRGRVCWLDGTTRR